MNIITYPYIIYKHTNNVNNKSYIGVTSKTLETRLNEHLKDSYRGSNLYFHKALRKYDISQWSSYILYQCNEINEAYRAEQELITTYATFGKCGYNCTSGGRGTVNRKVSLLTKKKLSEIAKKTSYFVTNPLYGEKNHMWKIGVNHPLYGKPRTSNTRAKISKNHANVKGTNNSNAKHIQIKSPEGIIYDTFGTFKVFCREHNLAYSSMNFILNERRKLEGSTKGWDCWVVK